jgi:hypothetical protein
MMERVDVLTCRGSQTDIGRCFASGTTLPVNIVNIFACLFKGVPDFKSEG